MKKKFFLFSMSVLALVSALFLSCETTGANAVKTAVPREADKEYSLTVLHLNDSHGAVLPNDKGQGGLAYLASCVKAEKAKNENTLFLHAGDMNTGSALSNMFKAEPDILAFNLMGLDYAAFGNHEFDGSLDVLKSQMKKSKFQWLSANVKTSKGYLTKPYAIRDYDGFRVAIIGLTTNRTLTIASPDKSLTFVSEVAAAKETVKLVREVEKADIVIVLGHLGDVEETAEQNTSIKLAQEVPGIDLIVDGHSHSYMETPKIVNGVYIVSANELCKYLGSGTMKIVDGKIKDFTWRAIPITDKDYEADPAVQQMLDPYIAKSNAGLKEVVLKTVDEFEFGNRLPRYKETAIGDFVSDAVVAYVKSTGVHIDGAFTNGGNIRAPLPKGDVTRENILTCLPFENYVYVLTLKGSDVEALFNFIASIKQGAGGFAQVSKEIRYTITYDADGKGTLSNLTIGGKPIDKDKLYRIATNDYLAGGGDGYEVLKKSTDTYNTSMLFSTVVIDYAQSLGKGAITPMTDGRIIVVGGKLPE